MFLFLQYFWVGLESFAENYEEGKSSRYTRTLFSRYFNKIF